MPDDPTNSAPRDLAFVLHDDGATVAFVRGVLAAQGIDAASAETAFAAMGGAPGAEPALALVGMTAVDDRDLEVVAFLRRRWPRTTIVALFPASLRERAAKALALGADASLPEPFYASEIASLAAAAVRRTRTAPSESQAVASHAAAPTTAPPGAAAAPTTAGASDDSLSKLAAGVAHTIRNPLQILELQLSSIEADGKVAGADVDGMRDQLKRIAGVVESLTRFSARRKLDTRLVDVNALVQRVFGAPPKSGPPARLQLAPEKLEVLGAPDLLRAGFESLRARAERVAQRDGEIRVRTSLAARADGVREVVVAVTDSGPALSAKQAASFFDPFPDADHVTDGSGLEMAALLGIVRHHGGAASVAHGGTTSGADGPRGGATVTVRLPARGRAAAGEEP
ncbi:MAG: hypothetical protein HMLKMBBP_03280 [Planctomycetes bacterium]|nr:hypothetical protein [Planctomycetota bacterium]